MIRNSVILKLVTYIVIVNFICTNCVPAYALATRGFDGVRECPVIGDIAWQMEHGLLDLLQIQSIVRSRLIALLRKMCLALSTNPPFVLNNSGQPYREVVSSRWGLINLDSTGGGGAKSSTSTINTGWFGSRWVRAISNAHLLNSELPFSWNSIWALSGISISECVRIYLSNSQPNVLCISQYISLLIIPYLLIKTFFIDLPIGIQIYLGKSESFVIIRDTKRYFFLFPISMNNILMGIAMRCIIANYYVPCFFIFYFKLYAKLQNFTTRLFMTMSSTTVFSVWDNELSKYLHDLILLNLNRFVKLHKVVVMGQLLGTKLSVIASERSERSNLRRDCFVSRFTPSSQ